RFFPYQLTHPRALHSFPTRRSSDLPSIRGIPPRGSRRTPTPPPPACRHHQASRRSTSSASPSRRQELVQLIKLETKDTLHRRVADRKSTRLNSSHVKISYAVFCLKK